MNGAASLAYPKKSHRKEVRLPAPSKELAEFIGIMLGDGGINNAWQANITLNSVADKAYARYVTALARSLFGIDPAVRKRKDRNTLVISLASTSLVDYLVARGLVRGNKILNGASIPEWVMKNKAFRKACLRGLMDTDGCLYLHKHKVAGKAYESIGLCFTSHMPYVLNQVAGIFEEFGVFPHISDKGRRIYVYQKDQVIRYMDSFGTSNPRIGSLYRKWRRG